MADIRRVALFTAVGRLRTKAGGIAGHAPHQISAGRQGLAALPRVLPLSSILEADFGRKDGAHRSCIGPLYNA
jgi:hypothetical protein